MTPAAQRSSNSKAAEWRTGRPAGVVEKRIRPPREPEGRERGDPGRRERHQSFGSVEGGVGAGIHREAGADDSQDQRRRGDRRPCIGRRGRLSIARLRLPLFSGHPASLEQVHRLFRTGSPAPNTFSPTFVMLLGRHENRIRSAPPTRLPPPLGVPASRRPSGGEGLVLLTGLAALAHFTSIVVGRFEGHRWNLPSRIYSDMFVLRPGDAGSPEKLVAKLERLLYRVRRGRARAGRPFPPRRATPSRSSRADFRYPGKSSADSRRGSSSRAEKSLASGLLRRGVARPRRRAGASGLGLRRGGPGPHARPPRGRAADAHGRGSRHRRPGLLPPCRRVDPAHARGPPLQREEESDAGWLDADPAARQEPLSLARTHAAPQGDGGGPGRHPGRALFQGRDLRGVHERDLSRAGRLDRGQRRRRGGAALLRQGGGGPRPGRVGDARRA